MNPEDTEEKCKKGAKKDGGRQSGIEMGCNDFQMDSVYLQFPNAAP
jgi:hypothetical protein